MASSFPYLLTPGTIDTAFKRIKDAATPPRFTNDFVNTVLQIKGGTGATLPPFFKKLGFLNSDGTPTALYDRFRNDASSKAAVADAIRSGFRKLYEANEYAHKLGDNDLKGLILQVTRLEKDNRVAQLIYSTFKKLVSHASFDGAPPVAPSLRNGAESLTESLTRPGESEPELLGMRLSYTFNLNLPATTNVEVFNAIFRSLKEHLLR